MITALVSRKGGVGKTTTAVNLAAALAAQGRRVLLVDLDSQASASLSLGVRREDLPPSSADLLLSGTPAREVIRRTSVEGLDLITASSDLSRADLDLAPFRSREIRLRSSLSAVAGDYGFVLLDCPPSMSLVQINALVAAQTFIVPVIPQFLAAAGVRNLIESAERLSWNGSRPARPLGVLLTLVDYRSKATRQTVDRLRAEYGSLVFAMEIRVNTRLAEAPAAGQTIFQYDAGATGAEAYRLLADEYVLRAGAAERKG
ncbi:MAG TPA: ParA family protein [Thermoanaerobaculia bacterium]|nr:ParA family protein [Thermoanaerobaculia bacterium]